MNFWFFGPIWAVLILFEPLRGPKKVVNGVSILYNAGMKTGSQKQKSRIFNGKNTLLICLCAAAVLLAAVCLAVYLWPEKDSVPTDANVGDPVDIHVINTDNSLTAEPVVTAEPTREATVPPTSDATPEPTEEASPEPTGTAAITPEPTRDPALNIGQSGDYVASLQDRLMELGYLDIDETTSFYGSSTAYAVQLFQRQHGLNMDGLAGQETLSIIFSNSAQHYAMKLDISGLDVQNLQQQLKDLGYLSASDVDGYYGESTKEAVMAFQSRNDLPINGVAGEMTIEKLFSPEAVPSINMMPEEIRKVNIQKMLDTAYLQLGKKYVLGGCGPNVFDCSGLVYYCMKQAGSTRGRYDAAGYSKISDWELITNMDDLQVGDLLFFYNNKFTKVGHVGIYIGAGRMIDASSSNGKVVCRSCTTYYWTHHFAKARRPWG